MKRLLLAWAFVLAGSVSLLVLAVIADAVVFLLALVAVLIIEFTMFAPDPSLPAWFTGSQVGPGFRRRLILLAVGVLAARVLGPTVELAVMLAGICAIYVADGEQGRIQETNTRRVSSSISWRNLPVPGHQLTHVAEEHSGRIANGLHSTVLLFLAAAICLADQGAAGWLAAGAGIVCAVAAAAALIVSRRHKSSHTLAEEVELRHAVGEALAGYSPEIVAHLSGYRNSAHTLNAWCASLERVEQRVLLVVRQSHHLELLSSTELPMVVLPAAADLSELMPESVLVALYPMNNGSNADLIDIPGILDVYIGHGDSDKAASANPETRIFDEIWVAGPAGRDRYRRAQIGVRGEQVRVVGRPQLMEIEQAGEKSRSRSDPFVVLYAPTWEGSRETNPYSSLKPMGEQIVRELMSVENVRVLYKAHPSTGTRDESYLRADAEIRRLLASAAGGHQVVEPLSGLYQSFNAADLVISDVGSVITDFLYSGKPYVVTNPRDEEAPAFRNKYPSAAGAPLLGTSCEDLSIIIEDARSTDTWAGKRAAVAAYLLGDSSQSPLARFQGAVTAAASIQLERNSRRTPRASAAS